MRQFTTLVQEQEHATKLQASASWQHAVGGRGAKSGAHTARLSELHLPARGRRPLDRPIVGPVVRLGRQVGRGGGRVGVVGRRDRSKGGVGVAGARRLIRVLTWWPKVEGLILEDGPTRAICTGGRGSGLSPRRPQARADAAPSSRQGRTRPALFSRRACRGGAKWRGRRPGGRRWRVLKLGAV